MIVTIIAAVTLITSVPQQHTSEASTISKHLRTLQFEAECRQLITTYLEEEEKKHGGPSLGKDYEYKDSHAVIHTNMTRGELIDAYARECVDSFEEEVQKNSSRTDFR